MKRTALQGNEPDAAGFFLSFLPDTPVICLQDMEGRRCRPKAFSEENNTFWSPTEIHAKKFK